MTDNHDREAKLLSLAVHELRTPLSVVTGYLRMLLRHFGADLSPEQRKLIEHGEASCGTLAGLLGELNELAQWDRGEVAVRSEPLAIVDLLTTVARDVHEGRDRGISIEVRAGAHSPRILGDAVHLATALTTLLNAALRERADATTVVADCRVIDEAAGTSVRIGIGDGVDVDAIFAEGGVTAFDQYRGGLGFRLLLAERILAAHGGHLASPVAARGRLAIVVSLPVAPDAESSGEEIRRDRG